MRRLITKELLETRWYTAAVLAVVLTLELLGNPMVFRSSVTAPGWQWAPMLAAFVMGLSGYSRETADGTLDFTFSRPVRWWWILLSKVLAGVIVLAGVVVVSLPIFLLRTPGLYRPSVDGSGLAVGMAVLWLALGAAYLTGLLMSSIVPGVVLTFTVAIGGIALWGALQGQATRVHSGPWVSAPLFAVLLVVAVLSVRPPLALAARSRMWLWAGAFAVGIGLMFVTAFTLRAAGRDPRPPDGFGQYASADRQAKAFCDYITPGEVWIEDSRGRFRKVDQAAETQSIGWAQTGRTFYYMVHVHSRAELRRVSEEGGWKVQTVCSLGPLNQDSGHLPRPIWNSTPTDRLDFSPSGRRFAVAMTRYNSMEAFVLAVDLDRHTAKRLPVLFRNGTERWWVDNNHIALAGDHFRVTVTELWPEESRSSHSPSVRP